MVTATLERLYCRTWLKAASVISGNVLAGAITRS